MNGFGHFSTSIIWYRIYGMFFAGLLIKLCSLLWVRAYRDGLWREIRSVAGRIDSLHQTGLSIMLIGWIGTGGFIFSQFSADYDMSHKATQTRPSLRIKHVDLDLELFPETRDVHISGSYLMRNETTSPIDELDVFEFPFRVSSVHVLQPRSPHRLVAEREETGYRRIAIDTPIQPGDTLRFDFDLSANTPGFSDTRPLNDLAHNGMYVDSFRPGFFFPLVGYSSLPELRDNRQRREFGLPATTPVLPDDPDAGRRSENQWITFDALVSADMDQTVVSPGDLVRVWEDAGRRFYHFRSTTKMIDRGLGFLSGRYSVTEQRVAGRSVEVYFHPDHAYNLDRMLSGAKASLEYGERHFGPYPFQGLRIAEVPPYGKISGRARALPGLFVWTETGGFLGRIDDTDAIDHVFSTTTHEMAHQWWGNQVNPAQVEGQRVLVETLAQWVRVRVMEESLGRATTLRFRRDELQNYLCRRGTDDPEVPMTRASSSSLLYNKGTIVMYALGDYIGPDSVNAALRRLVDDFAWSEGPFPTTSDLLRELRAVTPDSLMYLIFDLFESITLYALEATSATYTRLSDGRFEGHLDVAAKKMRADGRGAESEVPIDDYIDIAVFADEDSILVNQKFRIDASRKRFRIVVDGRPSTAGIDPYSILIDRNTSDNRIAVVSN